MKRITFYASVLVSFILFGPPCAQVSSGASSRAPRGNALLLADVHFDPLADPAIIKQLIATPASEWDAIFASSGQTGYAHSPHDANYPLLKSALSAAAPFDFVVALGDYLRHGAGRFSQCAGKSIRSSGRFPRRRFLRTSAPDPGESGEDKLF